MLGDTKRAYLLYQSALEHLPPQLVRLSLDRPGPIREKRGCKERANGTQIITHRLSRPPTTPDPGPAMIMLIVLIVLTLPRNGIIHEQFSFGPR